MGSTAAGEAPPDRRILLRDPIASFGAAAIRALRDEAWLGDPQYCAFAIRTITKAGEQGAKTEAVAALRHALELDLTSVHRMDAISAIQKLGGSTTATKAKPTSAGALPSGALPSGGPVDLSDLVEGQCYRRQDLHRAGLGGNRQKGISYPAKGTYVLLFSDPSKETEYGYRDAPVGDLEYRYFGEWDGTGEMSISGGNKAITERSPQLYLFTAASCGKVYRGKYSCISWSREPATRDGKSHVAIVFLLRKAVTP
jgi:hypothetical protein